MRTFCTHSYVSLGKLAQREPAKLQVIFPAHRLRVGDGDLGNQIDLVMSGAVLGVAVLDHAEACDLGFGSEFFVQLADQGGFYPLAGFDVAAGQERPRLAVLARHEELAIAADDSASDDLGGGSHIENCMEFVR